MEWKLTDTHSVLVYLMLGRGEKESFNVRIYLLIPEVAAFLLSSIVTHHSSYHSLPSSLSPPFAGLNDRKIYDVSFTFSEWKRGNGREMGKGREWDHQMYSWVRGRIIRTTVSLVFRSLMQLSYFEKGNTQHKLHPLNIKECLEWMYGW